MYCAKCGRKLTDDMNFCPQCGAELSGAASTVAALDDVAPTAGPQHAVPASATAAASTATEPLRADVSAGAASSASSVPAQTAPVSAEGAETPDAFPIFDGAAAASGAAFAAAQARSGTDSAADKGKSAKRRYRRALVGVRNCVLVVVVALLSGVLAYSALVVSRDADDSAVVVEEQADSDADATDDSADSADAADSDGDATDADAAADAADADATDSDSAAEGETSESIFADAVDDVAEGENEPTYTYTYSQIYQAVTLTTTFENAIVSDDDALADAEGQPGEGDAGSASTVQTTEATWSYPQFITTEGATTDALDLVNAALVAAYESALAASESWVEAEATSAQTIAHTDTVASLTSTYVSIRRYTYVTYWGTHGVESVTGLFFDLSTGEQVEPADALGFTTDELEAMATEAIYAYLASDENFTEDYFIDAEGTDAATLIAEAVDAIVTDSSRYYATADAIVVCTAPYELGDYSFGMQEIVIYAYSDAVTVGQAVGYGTN